MWDLLWNLDAVLVRTWRTCTRDRNHSSTGTVWQCRANYVLTGSENAAEGLA